jgi:putative PIN family toxin of toxin-antitoxin system
VAKVWVVLDANVLISGLLWTGIPHRLIQAAESGDLIPIASPAILQEVRDALGRPKFAARIRALETSVEELMESLLSIVEVIHNPKLERVVEQDPDDDAVLACAVASHAHYIISGDEHLLVLKRYREIPIMTPKEFWGKEK